MIYVTKPTQEAKDIAVQLQSELAGSGVSDLNMIISVGGDGAMLHAVKEHLDKNMPFLGVAAGRLGFLQTVDPANIKELGKALKEGEYGIIKAPLLAIYSHEKLLGYAFNDISIERSGARAVKLQVTIDGSTGSFTGDGLIFATPLGSTAYNLAAGGPIIDSNLTDAFVVTPNNPHVSVLYSSLQSPHILGRKRCVRVQIEDREERPFQVVVDGNVLEGVNVSSFEVKLSEKSVQLVELQPDHFHHRIQDKRLGQS